MATTVKSVRYTDDELALVKHLLDSAVFPNKTESEVLREAGILGLDIFKAHALLAGADVNPAFLRHLMIRLLPLFEVLYRYDALPQWLRSQPAGQSSAEPPMVPPAQPPDATAQAQSPTPSLTVAPEVKAMLGAFGTNFLSDDDDD